MKNRLKIAGAILAFSGLIASAKATIIQYELANNGGDSYTYSYTVHNNTAGAIEDFTIYFPNVSYTTPTPEYANFNVGGTVAGWDFYPTPASEINLSGFVDWSNSSGMAAGDTLSGFKVNFTYTGSGTPDRQFFDTFAANFEPVDSGMTTPVSGTITPVPESSTWIAGAFAAMFLAYNGVWRKPCCKKE